jgi:hypothetical protein
MASRAERSPAGVAEESRMVPSAYWPLTRRVRGPAAAEKTGGAVRGGWPSATSSSFT